MRGRVYLPFWWSRLMQVPAPQIETYSIKLSGIYSYTADMYTHLFTYFAIAGSPNRRVKP